MKSKTKEQVYDVSIYLICGLVALLCLYPLVYTLLVSFCSPHEINASYFLPIPQEFTLQAYAQVFTAGGYIVTAIGVSILRTAVGTVLSLNANVYDEFTVTVNAKPAYANHQMTDSNYDTYFVTSGGSKDGMQYAMENYWMHNEDGTIKLDF